MQQWIEKTRAIIFMSIFVPTPRHAPNSRRSTGILDITLQRRVGATQHERCHSMMLIGRYYPDVPEIVCTSVSSVSYRLEDVLHGRTKCGGPNYAKSFSQSILKGSENGLSNLAGLRDEVDGKHRRYSSHVLHIAWLLAKNLAVS